MLSIDCSSPMALSNRFISWGYAAGDEAGSTEYVGAVMDIPARTQAVDALRKSQGELAHVTRVMTMGELVALT
jgi:hypothetical protein